MKQHTANNQVKAGIAGLGSIGSVIVRHLLGNGSKGVIQLKNAFDPKPGRFSAVCKNTSVNKKTSLEDLAMSSDLVIEAASIDCANSLIRIALEKPVALMIISVGVFVTYPKLLRCAFDKGLRLYIPSGAIGGIDLLKAASKRHIDSVTLTTKKHPLGLAGAPYIEKQGLDITSLTAPAVIFEGSAAEAIQAFPKNVNVSSTVSIAGIGPDKTKVCVVCDPGLQRNTHMLEITGDFGRFQCTVENMPSPDNPKTSALASLSCIAMLDSIAGNIWIGT